MSTNAIAQKYTGNDSEIGRWQGGALNLSQAKPAPKAWGPQKCIIFWGKPLQLNLKSLAMQAGLKFSGCPTQPEPIFESRAVYTGYLSIFYHLLRRDLRIFKREFWGKLIDTGTLLFTTVILFSYFLPSYGLKSDYGPFILLGVIAGFGFFEIIAKVSQMIADLEGDKTILHTLSLPIPSWLVFVYIGVSWAILSSIIGLLMFPIGKLVLFSQFDLGKIQFFKLASIFLMSNLFFGFFALWLSSVLKKMSSIGHLFVRVVNPMYSFGGWVYSWQTAYQMSPTLGYAHFANPLIYIMEGMRGAALGPEGFLPFWLCFGALIAITSALGWDAVRRLKKRLDCI